MPPPYTRRMDAALEALEFPAIAERLAGLASTSRGEELARALAPSPEPQEVARRQALTAEAVALLDEAAEPPLERVATCARRPSSPRAEGALAGGPARVATTVRGGLALRGALDESAETAPLLRALAEPVDRSLATLADGVERCVEEDGSDLRDTASPLLRRLRKELREGRHRVAEELRRLARDPSVREHLQEEFVAERGGRPVLAVKASARRSVPGIVHDSSGSGQTLFVEPFAVVELSNRQSEAAGAEREEATRILRELSDAVGARADALVALVEAAAASTSRSRAARSPAAGAARRSRSSRRGQAARRPASAPRPCRGGPDRPRPRRPARARRQRPEHGREDRRAEDARARGAAAPGRAAPAGRDGRAARLRPRPGGHRRSAVDRDEPLDLLRARAQPRRRSSTGPPSGRSCSWTSSPPAPTPSRGRRSRRRCSSGWRGRRGSRW